MKLTRIAPAAVLAGLLALTTSACSGSHGITATPPTTSANARQTYVEVTPSPSLVPAATATPHRSADADQPDPTGTPTAAVPAGSLRYQKIREPFSRPGECQDDGNTQQMAACVLEQVIDVDSTVDALQLKRFEKAPNSKRAAQLAENANWLKGRQKTCAAAASGGSIDQVTLAQCLLRASQNRVETLNDVG